MTRRHDLFGMPDVIRDVVDLSVVECGRWTILNGTPWTDHVKLRAAIDADHESGDHRCGEEDCVWCPAGEDCDEHAVAYLWRAEWPPSTEWIRPELIAAIEARLLGLLRKGA